MNAQDLNKQKAAAFATRYIEDGMVVGLGTGSTVAFFLDALAEKNLNITGVTTSNRTAARSAELGIKIVDIDEVDHIDVTVDGADEVDAYLNGIKGGGAALLMEKIVAKNSTKNIWIVDESKVKPVLGSFPLPVEVVPYGSGQLAKKLASFGLNPKLRVNAAGETVVTDGGHFILDLNLSAIDNPFGLSEMLNQEIGVVEHGLFLGIANTVIIGGDEIQVKERRH
ncbi:ribose-5-phosphate isomerase RpiA [Weissella diestrammenae]|uniref:Ribose-5-phosphate isomerase A n=1 Tax=Weissella diestrammenae TaxID=1162633 RepID=A0A7G9T7E8_9LACO|nr:ribose-5-phosphate isomerase RpiA [Weissella diestrammenae]MCM0582038.1 ribose-5-phosphate isomerase RpiA [Weissella diestrammenae]QNN76023.1 ribose-5-phosphate isomerase RpiA [Weissella diestrammenae]